MSGRGVGRGRGWLNLSKPQKLPENSQPVERPGSVPSPILYSASSLNSLTTGNDKEFADIENTYSDLIEKVKLICLTDDGIKFNQKIKYIVENWIQDCPTGDDVESSFEAVHQACLNDAELASKLVFMISSRTFLSQEIHRQNIRLMFLRKLQDNFENSSHLKATNPTAFRNSILMMGEFYNKARLSNGQQFTFMATPLVSYLEMLLEDAHLPDLRLFTIQFCLNGSSLKNEVPEKLSEVLNTIRLLLVSEPNLAKEARLWLLLALEVASNRFGILPADIHKFYQEQLGDAAMGSFQGSLVTLSVQTHTNKTLESYQSNVNVLQVSTSSESANDQIPSPHRNSISDVSVQNFDSSGFQSESNSSETRPTSNEAKSIGKTGRPILGVGARLSKNRSTDENTVKWRNKNGGDKWEDSRQKSESYSRDINKIPKSNKKGWEHDDRFETDYS